MKYKIGQIYTTSFSDGTYLIYKVLPYEEALGEIQFETIMTNNTYSIDTFSTDSLLDKNSKLLNNNILKLLYV